LRGIDFDRKYNMENSISLFDSIIIFIYLITVLAIGLKAR